MKKNAIYTTLFMLLVSLYILPVNAAEALPKSVEKTNSTEYELLFFMNPHGRPCQYQDQIINEIGEAVNSVASVRYYKTTNRADHQSFRTYGVRGLPMLMVIDKKGNTVKRFSPGVQTKETILATLEELNK